MIQITTAVTRGGEEVLITVRGRVVSLPEASSGYGGEVELEHGPYDVYKRPGCYVRRLGDVEEIHIADEVLETWKRGDDGWEPPSDV